MFIVALYTIARTWKQPRCPSTDEWINKMLYIDSLPLYHLGSHTAILCVCVCVLSHTVIFNSCNPMDCSPPGSSVHGVIRTRILEWSIFSPPGDLSKPGIEPATCMSAALADWFFTTEPFGKPTGILVSRRKEQNWVMYSDGGEPWAYHMEWSKSENENQILYINVYLWNLAKMALMGLFTGQEHRHRCREQTCRHRAMERAGQIQRVALTYKHHHV